MWRLVLTVSLLSCSSEGSVTCRDENNNPVDWYILYKTPRNQNEGLDGLDYVYIYPENNNKAERQQNNKKINSSDGILANTLQPLSNPPSDFGYIIYSDQPPDGYPKAPSSYGHSKGVVMVQKNLRGVWLLHSTPRFPYDRKPDKFWPKSGARNGQTFICVTFNYDQFEHIGTHLQYIEAFPFDHHIPDGFHSELQQPEPEQKRKTDFQQLTSSGGKVFNSIAKQLSADGKAEDGDLYVSISKEVKSDVHVQTWGCQRGRKDLPGRSLCLNGTKVQNIQYVKTYDNWGEWKATKDHSKWCVAVNTPWTCIADVNRSESQYKRPGGALCVEDADIHTIFKSFVQNVEDCSGSNTTDLDCSQDSDSDVDDADSDWHVNK